MNKSIENSRVYAKSHKQGAVTSPAGANYYVQYYNAGAFGANINFRIDAVNWYMNLGNSPVVDARLTIKGDTISSAGSYLKCYDSNDNLRLHGRNDGYFRLNNSNSRYLTYYETGVLELKQDTWVNTLNSTRNGYINGNGNIIGVVGSFYAENYAIIGNNNILASVATHGNCFISGDSMRVNQGNYVNLIGDSHEHWDGSHDTAIGSTAFFNGNYIHRNFVGWVGYCYNASYSSAYGYQVGFNGRDKSIIHGSGIPGVASLIVTSAYPQGLYYGVGTDEPEFAVTLAPSGAGAGKANNIGLGRGALILMDNAGVGERIFWIQNYSVEPTVQIAGAGALYSGNSLPRWIDDTGRKYYLGDGAFYTSVTTKTITNSAAETTIFDDLNAVGSRTIKANTARVGKQYVINAYGCYGTRAVLTSLQLKSYWSATNLTDTGASPMPTGVAGKYWRIQLIITIRSIGAPGSASCDFMFFLDDGSATKQVRILDDCNNIVAIDTTVDNAIDIKATFGHADANNTINQTNSNIQCLNNL